MAAFNNVLVVNDQLEGLDTALHKAALIEHYTGCHIQLAAVVWNEIEDEEMPEHLKAELIENFVAAERQGLRQLSEPLKEKVADVDVQAIWARRSEEAITTLQQSTKADLLIKPAADSELLDYLYAPLDWRLIRNSACPVLISKSAQWQTQGHVLAAVDVANPKHADINQKIIAAANTLAEVLAAQVHLVTVFPDLGQSVNERQVAMDYAGLKADMRNDRQQRLEKLALQVPRIADLHVLEGKAQRLVPHLATTMNATITVVGTHARKGIGKLVLGNTAEKLLPRMQGDVLTVRL